jgi:hypothetical protein
MVETLNDSNIFNRLILAFMYNHEELKADALSHITNLKKAQNYKTIFKLEEWKEFERKRESLAKEIKDAVEADI